MHSKEVWCIGCCSVSKNAVLQIVSPVLFSSIIKCFLLDEYNFEACLSLLAPSDDVVQSTKVLDPFGCARSGDTVPACGA